MNEQDALRDEWEDRLAQHSLGELLGGKSPPDLSERILAAAAMQPVAAQQDTRILISLAASVLLAITFGGVYSAYQNAANLREALAREDAKRAAEKPRGQPNKLVQVAGGMETQSPRKEPHEESTSNVARHEKLAVLVDQFNQLMDEHRYPEAEVIAKQAKDVAPNEPVVKQINLMVKMVSRTRDEQGVLDANEQTLHQALNNVDSAAIPFDDKKPFAFGEVNDWKAAMPGMMPGIRSGGMPDGYGMPGRGRGKKNLARHRQESNLRTSELTPRMIGLPDDSPVLYPDAETWQQIAQRRKKYRIVDQEQDGESGEAKETYILAVPYPEADNEAGEPGQYSISISSSDQNSTATLDERLETPVQVKLRSDVAPIPLGTALALLGKEVGLEFRIEPEQLANVPVMPPELSGQVSVRGALATILQSHGFNLAFEDNRICVTDKNSPDEGRGAGEGGDRYSRIIENPFLDAVENPLSTFSIDVDTASYAKVRRYLLEESTLPPPDAVRIEELINYFSYDLPQPEGDAPFAAKLEAAGCPWQPKHRLLRISLKAREIAPAARPAANLVFLLDVSGSMQPDDKLPRVIRSMRLLTEQLREQDRVAMVTYAGSSGLALPSTSGSQKEKILSALESLVAGGSTNGGEGIALAYATAAANFVKGGTNRVILCTDGDFNVGTTSDADLERLIEEQAASGVFLTVLGFGMGNHNDQMLEKLADKGNGNYGYIDTEDEARKLLVDQAGGTLVTVAKDVKLQLEFNPRQVAAYRLIGYEDRLLRAEDFNDDRKDAGEIGAGHAVTALYELIPAGVKKSEVVETDPLKYQRPAELTPAADADELATLKVRYKEPDGDARKAPVSFVARDAKEEFAKASADFKFAAAVAAFGMLLRNSEYKGDFTYDAVLEIAQEGLGADVSDYRKAFLEMVRKAKGLAALKRP